MRQISKRFPLNEQQHWGAGSLTGQTTEYSSCNHSPESPSMLCCWSQLYSCRQQEYRNSQRSMNWTPAAPWPPGEWRESTWENPVTQHRRGNHGGDFRCQLRTSQDGFLLAAASLRRCLAASPLFIHKYGDHAAELGRCYQRGRSCSSGEHGAASRWRRHLPLFCSLHECTDVGSLRSSAGQKGLFHMKY